MAGSANMVRFEFSFSRTVGLGTGTVHRLTREMQSIADPILPN
jgi:hypothetical protein